MGKGSVSRHDPRCLFTVGIQQRDHVLCALEHSDVVLAVGYDMVEYKPEVWNPANNKTIIHMDFCPAEIDHHYHADVEVVGDIAAGLQMLIDRVDREGLKFDVPYHREMRAKMLEEFAAHRADDTEGTIRPQKALWDARQAMGPEDIVLSDVGAHKMWVARYFQCDAPNTCLISNGFCSMGFALPGAIAAKMIHPDRRVLAVCGDAGFLMNVQDLETARRLGTNPVYMIWEDHGYGLIEWKQENEFKRHSELSFNNPDWVKLAESFDCKGMRVENARDLAPALDEAFTSDRPVIMVIPIDYRENQKLTERLGNIEAAI
jgi:acetolactate synthase-1/2/3 large subunit